MRISGILTLILFSTLLFSCRTQRATYNYLEEIKDTSFRESVYFTEPLIQKNDLISIRVYSASLDPSVDQLYNPTTQQNQNAQNMQNSGYLVDVNGNIEMPRIGTLHVEGLKKSALEALIKSKLEAQLTQPSVVVRFLNFRVTVLGEVGTPGLLTIPTEKLTILEAVGMAGGITEYGMIKNIKILRENNGVRQLGTMDLTSRNIFQSPYYQLQQNDVVLVDQTPYRLRRTEQTRIMQQIGFALTIITSIALIYNIFK
jgi:polysaccharide biosynthesis/export protein